jgi:nucleoside-diphosphate-sugar epimerase
MTTIELTEEQYDFILAITEELQKIMHMATPQDTVGYAIDLMMKRKAGEEMMDPADVNRMHDELDWHDRQSSIERVYETAFMAYKAPTDHKTRKLIDEIRSEFGEFIADEYDWGNEDDEV